MKSLLLLLTTTILPCAASSSLSTTSRLEVHIPHSLAKRYAHHPALFGMQSLEDGRSLIESLYWVGDNVDLCTQQGTLPPLYPPRSSSNTTAPEEVPSSPFILLVRRSSNCNFVKQVRNAQRLGAAGVLMGDSVCLCSDKVCQKQQQEQEASKNNSNHSSNNDTSPVPSSCQEDEPVMKDDGSGSTISIPSFLVDKVTADLFIEHLQQDHLTQPMRIEMAYTTTPPQPAPTPNKNDDQNKNGIAVFYDLWMQPTGHDGHEDDDEDLVFWDNLETVTRALSSSSSNSPNSAASLAAGPPRFTPHATLYDGVAAGCHEIPKVFDYDLDEDMPCYNLCTNRGRYCAADPDGNLHGGLSGADVVTESLRRACIWNLYGKNGQQTQDDAEEGRHKWFAYAAEFQRRCASGPPSSTMARNPVCIQSVMDRVGIDGGAVAQCMEQSGGTTQNRPNVLLEQELSILHHRGIYVVPTAQVLTTSHPSHHYLNDEEHNDDFPSPNGEGINYLSLHGSDVTPESLFVSVCQAMSMAGLRSDVPEICHQCSPDQCSHTMHCLRSNGQSCSPHAGLFGGGGGSGGEGISVQTLQVTVLCLLVLSVGAAVWHRHYHTRPEHLQRQVQTLLAEYHYSPMTDGPGAAAAAAGGDNSSSSSDSDDMETGGASSSSSSSSSSFSVPVETIELDEDDMSGSLMA